MIVSLPISDAITYDWSSWLTDKTVAVYNANITDISASMVKLVLQQAKYSELFMLLLAMQQLTTPNVWKVISYDDRRISRRDMVIPRGISPPL